MPLPKALAIANRAVVNHAMRPVASRIPPLALVEHLGRSTGNLRTTPVLALKTCEGWAIALVYGPDVDWLGNVLAAGGCGLRRGGRSIALAEPSLRSGDGALDVLPSWLRPVLKGVGVDQVLTMRQTRP